MGQKVIIVGGVAGGASTAARLRRLDESAEIILFERGEHISFANCGLPYYIGDVIHQKERLLVQTPQQMNSRFTIDVRVLSEVVSIDKSQKIVTVKNLALGEEYTETYDALVLSPGAEPVKMALPGIDSPGVYTLRNLPDTFRIRAHVDEKHPQRALVVGGGYIGIEMAENLHARGIAVTVVEFAPQIIAPLDPEMAAMLQQHMRQKGVDLRVNTGLASIAAHDGHLSAQFSTGDSIETDLIILAVGVRPENKLAKEAGLTIGALGGIAVDDHMRTSDPAIYAVGDAVEVKEFVTGKPALIALAGPANKQGRVAAENIAGRDSVFAAVQGATVLKVFDMNAAAVGASEKVLKRHQISYLKTYVHPLSHASYYPNGEQMTLKLLFAPDTGKILGAQAIGGEGVDKRIDVISTCQRMGGTVYDLEKLELCYAPPFSSAKDPVNMAGFTAANQLRGDSTVFHVDELGALPKDAVLIDVRTKQEYELGAIPGSINIPVDALRSHADSIPKDQQVYIYCQVGLRGYVAQRMLNQMGFDKVLNLSGGYKLYRTVSEEEKQASQPHQPHPVNCIGHSLPTSDEKEPAIRAASVTGRIVDVDASGLCCPGPIMQVNTAMKDLSEGDILRVTATDPAFGSDIKAWCERTGNTLNLMKQDGNRIITEIVKGGTNMSEQACPSSHDKTIVVFSGDFDRAMATFIIANGAAAMGRKVTLFFTFWGLNILRKHKYARVKKDVISRMFGMMMPRGSRRLSLSKLNMVGMGTAMMRGVMRKKNVSSLEELINSAKQAGVKLVACQMTMDIMGLSLTELIDGVEVGGVAGMLGSAEMSDMTLFI